MQKFICRAVELGCSYHKNGFYQFLLQISTVWRVAARTIRANATDLGLVACFGSTLARFVYPGTHRTAGKSGELTGAAQGLLKGRTVCGRLQKRTNLPEIRKNGGFYRRAHPMRPDRGIVVPICSPRRKVRPEGRTLHGT